MDNAKRVINGTFGSVWIDGDYVSECRALQAKVSFNKEDVTLAGQMATDKKITGLQCSGSLEMYKVNSRMANLIGEKIRNGEDVRFTILSKLKDPDSYGAERILLKNVSFDDLTLADWTHNTGGRITSPFTFTDYEYLDNIEE